MTKRQRKTLLNYENPFDPKTHPFCHKGHDYAISIVSEEIPACRRVIGACRRYLSDIESEVFYFDADRAEKYLRVVQQFKHVKGEWKSPTIVYEPWQNWVFMNIEGFINRETRKRRFRSAYVAIPRGNGKSLMASQSVLFHLALDNPKGNEISCVATKVDQARIVLDSARVMANNAPKYLQKTGVKVLAHKIVHPRSASVARALSSDGKSLDGLNDILSVMDELHAIPKPLFDVIYSGLSKRNDSLMLMITTAGFNTDSVGHSQSKYAEKVALGEIKDEQLFAVEYTIDPEDDIYSEVTWRKANPGYGVSVDPVTIAAKASKAKEVPSDLANFKVKHLNVWMSEARAFYDANKWDKCADYKLKIEDFKGKPCRVGIDLASHIDLTSLGIVFFDKGKYYIFDKSYIPEETIRITNSAIYADCVGNGHLISTRGEAINYEYILSEILDITKAHKVIEAFYDPWNAIEMGQSLEKKRVNSVKFQMNVANFSEPMKKLDSLMREGKVVHNGSPLLRWALSNVVAKEDHNGNVFPRKSEERLKIDPIIAVLMALAGWLQDAKKESVYHDRGIRSF